MNNRSLALLISSFLGFVMLGMPAAMLGVAWPSMRATFDVSLDSVGLLLIASTIGFTISSVLLGPMTERFGLGPVLIFGVFLRAVGLSLFGFTSFWWFLLVLELFVGMSGGIIDSGLNSFVATNHSAKISNWLHASFGVGATLGPLVVTAVLAWADSWRIGYLFAGGLQLLVALLFFSLKKQWVAVKIDHNEDKSTEHLEKAPSMNLLQSPLILLSILLFFVYAGNEVTAGQWVFTLFTEARGIEGATAGIWISIYWGSLTVGRFLIGFVTERFSLITLLRACVAGVLVGALMLILPVSPLIGFSGLALMGFAMAPIFPLLISATPMRVGHARAVRVVGYQVAAAGIGVSILPALVGILADNVQLEMISWSLVGFSVLQWIILEASGWMQRFDAQLDLRR